MPTPPISTTGLRMPDDFEYDSYEAVHSRMAPLIKAIRHNGPSGRQRGSPSLIGFTLVRNTPRRLPSRSKPMETHRRNPNDIAKNNTYSGSS
jgi:hypothetical protein